MGTNYYLRTPNILDQAKAVLAKAMNATSVRDVKEALTEIDDLDDRLHIGKSSGGWCFALHVMPEEGITSLEDWIPLLKARTIEDEYGQVISFDEMMDVITNRSGRAKSDNFDYARNHAIPGPNNLARHRLMKDHCIGHGDGTWDLIVGSFS